MVKNNLDISKTSEISAKATLSAETVTALSVRYPKSFGDFKNDRYGTFFVDHIFLISLHMSGFLFVHFFEGYQDQKTLEV